MKGEQSQQCTGLHVHIRVAGRFATLNQKMMQISVYQWERFLPTASCELNSSSVSVSHYVYILRCIY